MLRLTLKYRHHRYSLQWRSQQVKPPVVKEFLRPSSQALLNLAPKHPQRLKTLPFHFPRPAVKAQQSQVSQLCRNQRQFQAIKGHPQSSLRTQFLRLSQFRVSSDQPRFWRPRVPPAPPCLSLRVFLCPLMYQHLSLRALPPKFQLQSHLRRCPGRPLRFRVPRFLRHQIQLQRASAPL